MSSLHMHTSSNYVDCLKADTGASGTFLKEEHAKYLHNACPAITGPKVHLPNNTILRPSHHGVLSLHDSLANPNLNAYVLPGMTNESLLSIGQLCDQGCKAIFTKDKLLINQGNTTILQGTRNPHDGLWDIPFKQNHNLQLNYIVTKDKTKFELAQYLHACAFSPSISTFLTAIKNANFIS